MKTKLLNIAELIDAFRVIPRLILVGYAVLVWIVVGWYMELPDPTTQHAALVTTVVGIIAPVAGLYGAGGRNWGNAPAKPVQYQMYSQQQPMQQPQPMTKAYRHPSEYE